MTDVALSRHLAALLADPIPATAARALADEARDGGPQAGCPDWLVALSPACEQGDPMRPMLPPLGALGLHIGAVALVRSGEGGRAWPFLERACEAYADRRFGCRSFRWHTPIAEALHFHPDLHVAAVDALPAARAGRRRRAR